MPRKYSNIPTILVVLGATGDLMAKKIVPALYSLFWRNELPQMFKVIGFARRDLSAADFEKHVTDIIHKFHPDSDKKTLSRFLQAFSYERGNFQALADYKNLNNVVKKIDDVWGVCSNKLFYLAVPPHLYKTIFENLNKSHLTDPCSPEEGWTRVIVEKPFGSDYKSAKDLDKLLAKLFREIQIYRIDHYLAKEMLQNILAFRFTNNLFEEGWNNDHIEKINIRALEKIGVEQRGGFYDGVGAFRDFGQNHLLQMLALVTMERPSELNADSIREQRYELLERLRALNKEEIQKFTFRAQYNGYRQIKGVATDSETETYFKIKMFLDSPRWEGVPITIESGKRLGEPLKEIEIIFRHPKPCLCPNNQHYKNRLIVHLEPHEGITIKFWSKKAGLTFDVEERSFYFAFRDAERKFQYTEEYEKLLMDCITGDQTLFVSSAEIAAMWKFTDPIVAAWQKGAVPLHRYEPDSKKVTEEARTVDNASLVKKTVNKKIGIVGLGKMGANIARRLRDGGWTAVGYDLNSEATESLKEEGFDTAVSLENLAKKLKAPRLIWLMVPAFAKATAGKPARSPVDEVIFGKAGLANFLQRGDTVIDAGNSFFEGSVRRAKLLKKKGINFLDVGVSGGPSGARDGAALMVGGDEKVFRGVEELFEDLALSRGYAYFGRAGAGHFVKMVHNGIEYGMMQAVGEGFAVMKKSPYKLNLNKVAAIYNRGSVIESRLLGWLRSAFEEYGIDLNKVSGSVGYTGEGEWTVKTGKKLKVPTPVIKDAFEFRVKSKKQPGYIGKILSALRNQFGGHSIKGK